MTASTRHGIIEDIQAEWAEEVLVDPPLARCIHNTVNGKAHCCYVCVGGSVCRG